tara:strand:+ start:233 stop:748 length:516 start_codon:yes stop_codon:yes gene_type:complete
MLTIESLGQDKCLSVFLAVQFAEKALPVWEKKHPQDMRPREVIELTKIWFQDPINTNLMEAAIASKRIAVSNNGDPATYSAHAAAYAASAAVSVAAASLSASKYAAYAAAKALNVNNEDLIHGVILKNLNTIFYHKLEVKNTFAQPELIFNYLNQEQKECFLFNLDIMASS